MGLEPSVSSVVYMLSGILSCQSVASVRERTTERTLALDCPVVSYGIETALIILLVIDKVKLYLFPFLFTVKAICFVKSLTMFLLSLRTWLHVFSYY